MSTHFNGRVTPIMQRILDALKDSGDMDIGDLADAACTCRNTLSGGGYLRKMLDLKLIRVSKWERNAPGAPTPIYSITPGNSIKPPRVYSASERTKRWRVKVGYRGAEYARRQALRELLRITA
mgnify:CR=1 FL=1